MTKRQLQDRVIPVLSLIILFGGIFTFNLISKLIDYNDEDLTIPTVEIQEDTMDVTNDISDSNPIRPYNGENIEIAKYYYNKDDDESRQEKSLIKYENIYMPNTGILYTSNNQFEILSILNGKVTNIKEDNILGNVIEISYSNNIVAVYECLTDVKVSVGDIVEQGDVIGLSSNKVLDSDQEYGFHFEVYKDNKIINPETLYNS